ncbi:hypothetical protein K7X08_029828 [Anisodus acutangulus]|uniref:Uncharacterized protein n=1 Tax=Anisodus acutangulus TaxID=402998 RepID=A0A9Q1M1P6_9SOLA|nr:hypothetical protein K7X08_029828 [Anisodus acutangulus]
MGSTWRVNLPSSSTATAASTATHNPALTRHLSPTSIQSPPTLTTRRHHPPTGKPSHRHRLTPKTRHQPVAIIHLPANPHTSTTASTCIATPPPPPPQQSHQISISLDDRDRDKHSSIIYFSDELLRRYLSPSKSSSKFTHGLFRFLLWDSYSF